mgnify:CR=1 FL=1
MLRKNRNKSLKESIKNENNVIEHIFNVHDDCNKNWCYAKRELEENLSYIPSEDHNFYCKYNKKCYYI